MGTIGDAKDAAGLRPFAIAIPSKQGVMLVTRDSSPGATRSRPVIPVCPAYRFCRESRRPYRPPMLDTDHDQQITTLHDLLQAIKEAALKLVQLIASDIEERRRRDADPRTRYPDVRYERSKQLPSPGSSLIATTSSSVCALCGVSLHLKDSSEESKQFDKERIDDYILAKHLDNMLFKVAYKVPSSAERGKNSDNFVVPRRVFDYILPGENIDKGAKRQKNISSKTQLKIDTSNNELKSKLLFIRRMPSEATYQTQHQDGSQRSDSESLMPKYGTRKYEYTTKDSKQCIANISSIISSTQDASTLTQELCPCACGLLMRDGTESEVSIDPMPILKDKLVKTKLEKLGFHLESTELAQAHDTIRVKKTKTQKEKDQTTKVERWIEEMVQLRLDMQIEKLHKNIQFFKQENEYIRRLSEKCRCLSEDMRGLQQLLPTKDTHTGFATTLGQAKYHSEHGIIAMLTGMFQGSMNIQQVTTRLLASLLEHNMITTSAAPSAPRA